MGAWARAMPPVSSECPLSIVHVPRPSAECQFGHGAASYTVPDWPCLVPVKLKMKGDGRVVHAVIGRILLRPAACFLAGSLLAGCWALPLPWAVPTCSSRAPTAVFSLFPPPPQNLHCFQASQPFTTIFTCPSFQSILEYSFHSLPPPTNCLLPPSSLSRSLSLFALLDLHP